MRPSGIRHAKTGTKIVRIGNAIQHEQQRLLHLLEDVVQAVGEILHLDPRHDPLVPPAAVEAIEALGRYQMQTHARALGDGRQILCARVVARFVEEDFDDRLRIGAQPCEDGVEAEHYSRLSGGLPAHTGSRDYRSLAFAAAYVYCVLPLGAFKRHGIGRLVIARWTSLGV